MSLDDHIRQIDPFRTISIPAMWCDLCKCMHSDYTLEDDRVICRLHPFNPMRIGKDRPIYSLHNGELLQPKPASKTVPEMLRDAAATYEQRNRLYGDNYKRFGDVMAALFPNGIELKNKDDWNRFGVFFHVVGKVTRYAVNLKAGGHKDSAHDITVYAAMLEELTQEPQPTKQEK